MRAIPASWTCFLFCLLLSGGTFAQGRVVIEPGYRVEGFFKGGPLTRMASMVVSDDGKLFVANANPASLVEIDLATRVATVRISGLPMSSPNNILIGDGRPLVGTDLIYSDHNTEVSRTCCDGRVLRIDRQSFAHQTLVIGNPTPTVGDPAGIALGPGGAFGTGLYVMDFQGASPDPPVLFRKNPDNSETIFLVDANQWTRERSPSDLAFDPTGAYRDSLFVLDNSATPGRLSTIWEVNDQAQLTPFYEVGLNEGLAAMAFGSGGAFGSELFVQDNQVGETKVRIVDPSAGTRKFASLPVRGTGSGAHLAFAPNDEALYIGRGNFIYRIVPYRLQVGNLVAGSRGSFTLEGATPARRQFLFFSLRGPGRTPLPSTNLVLNLDRASLFAKGTADGDGKLSLSSPVPMKLGGRTLWFQAAERGSRTNVTSTTVQ